MKATQGINWNLAKVLRGQGFTWDEIAAKVGAKKATLQVKASREGWTRLDKEGAKAMQELATQQTAAIMRDQAPKLVEQWLEKAQADTLEALETLRELPKPKNWKDAQVVENTRLAHIKGGRAIFGLDDQKGGGVQVNIMAQLNQLVNATPVAASDATVVDVPSNETE